MCQHSIPSLIRPLAAADWHRVPQILLCCFLAVLSFYLLLGLTAMYRFDGETLAKTQGLYTLAFGGCGLPSVSLFLEFFPIFVLTSSYPVIGITLRNNLRALLDVPALSPWQEYLLYPSLAILPPFLLALQTHNVEGLVAYTGSYAGAAVQYLVPAALVHRSRQLAAARWSAQEVLENPYRSWFGDPRWPLAIAGWALAAVAFVTLNRLR